MSKEQINHYHIEDLLIDFDEMGFVPTTACPDPEAYAIEWKEKLTNALEDYRKQEWISVEERLPGVSGRYICAVKDKNGQTWTVAGDYSLEMKKWFGLMFGEIKNTVTHWMPLPSPPEKEKNND
jgi:hypothetical protein